jgi:hypothetical protein
MGAKAGINFGYAVANQQENNAIYRLELEVLSTSSFNNQRIQNDDCGATFNSLATPKNLIRKFRLN